MNFKFGSKVQEEFFNTKEDLIFCGGYFGYSNLREKGDKTMTQVRTGDTVSIVRSKGLAPVQGRVTSISPSCVISVKINTDGTTEKSVNHISRSNGEVGWYSSSSTETVENDPSNLSVINVTSQDSKVNTDRLSGLLRESRTDLDLIKRLIQNLRSNQMFHNSLESQVNVIAERAEAVHARFVEVENGMKNQGVLQPSTAPDPTPTNQIPSPSSGSPATDSTEIANKRAQAGQPMTDAQIKAAQEEQAKVDAANKSKKEEPFDLNKFKDK